MIAGDAQYFEPQAVQRNRCTHCGTLRHAHAHGTLECPQPYRPETLADAMREYAAATSTGDQNRIFAARGEVQRQHGARHTEGCEVCRLLEVSP